MCKFHVVSNEWISPDISSMFNRRMNSRWKWLFALIAVFVVLKTSGLAPPARIVAVGDIHGACDAFISILQKARLIDTHLHWSGGRATLVQTGDILDRGLKSKAAMDLLMALEAEAGRQKGRVLGLNGNHEIMNIMGDLRYVSEQEFAGYAHADTEKRRQEAFIQYGKWRKGRVLPDLPVDFQEQWMKLHPPGFIEHRMAFSEDGKYGRWLRKRPVVAELDGIIFLHGGISPTLEGMKVETINEQIKKEIRLFDDSVSFLRQQNIVLPFFTLDEMLAAAREEYDRLSKLKNPDPEEAVTLRKLLDFLSLANWLCVRRDGPVWFRGYAEWSDAEGAPQISALLEQYHVQHFVGGHTVQEDGRIHTRFGGAVFLIDTGMNTTYVPTGRVSALQIENGVFLAIYLNDTMKLIPETQTAPNN